MKVPAGMRSQFALSAMNPTRRWTPVSATSARGFGRCGWLILFILTLLVLVWTAGVLNFVMRLHVADDQQQQPVEILPVKTVSSQTVDSTAYVFEYWKRGPELADLDSLLLAGKPLLSSSTERYITFEDDAGGWNNIRMAFECFVLAAKLTGRTLVLPPRVRFYLLDHGPIKLFQKPEKSYSKGYGDYFDLDWLRQQGGLRIITTDEFLKRYPFQSGELTEEILATAQPKRDADVARNGQHTAWFLFLRDHQDTVIWPSGPSATGEFALRTIDRIRSVAIHKRIIHFPVHLSKSLRYLDGAPALVSIAPQSIVMYSKMFLRQHLHYNSQIIEVARAAVERLGGMLSYSCIHVRRNELQYKSSFLSAQASLKNVRDAFNPDEHIYIATDETEPGFFQAFTDEGFRVSRLKDALESNPLPSKYEGMIEQLICAYGRAFVGTSTSTFSSYMNRLRLYIWADRERDARLRDWLANQKSTLDLQCWFHDQRPRSLRAVNTYQRGPSCGDISFTKDDSMFAISDVPV